MEHPYFHLPFFTNLMVLLVAARILGEVFERFKQPAMLGEILAGMLLGPTLFNIIHRTHDIQVISELGIFLLVIMAGLEINVDAILRSLKGRNLIISLLAFFLPIGSGFFVGHFFGLPTLTAVFVGLCVAITALPVSIRILMDLGKIKSDVGQQIISIAIFDDVLALSVLGVLLNVKDSDMSVQAISQATLIALGKLILLVILLAMVYRLVKRYSKRGNQVEESVNRLLTILKGKEPLFALFFVFVLLFSTVTEALGLHFIVGAFFASLLISESLVGPTHFQQIEKTTSHISMGFLAPIFFAGIGLEFQLSSIENIPLLLAVLVVSYASKIAGGYLGGRLAGHTNSVALTLGIGLNARGIMELVIANIAYKAGIIDLELFSILVLMGIVTTLTTPILLKVAFKKLDRASV